MSKTCDHAAITVRFNLIAYVDSVLGKNGKVRSQRVSYARQPFGVIVRCATCGFEGSYVVGYEPPAFRSRIQAAWDHHLAVSDEGVIENKQT